MDELQIPWDEVIEVFEDTMHMVLSPEETDEVRRFFLDQLPSFTENRNEPVANETIQEIAVSYLHFRLDNSSTWLEAANKKTKQAEMRKSFASLQTLTVYAGLQPLVLEARRELLGDTKALASEEEMIRWMREEASRIDVPKFQMMRVEYRFVIDREIRSSDLLPGALEGEDDTDDNAKGHGLAHFKKLYEEHSKYSALSFEGWNPDYPNNETEIEFGVFGIDSGEGKLDWIRLNTERLIRLQIWAQKLCETYPPLRFSSAIRIILTGRAARAAINPRIEEARFITEQAYRYALGDRTQGLELFERQPTPYVELTIGAMEVSPGELHDFYTDLRKRYRFGGRGRTMTSEAEILGVAALQLIWEEEAKEVNIKGQEFCEKVRNRYRDIAPSYGLDPNFYHEHQEGDTRTVKEGSKRRTKKVEKANSGTPKTWRAVAKALGRIEEAHASFYERTLVKNPNVFTYRRLGHSIFSRF